MNQKLRTAHSGIVFLFAVLCIVCLSLSLVISANFAAYADGEEIKILDYEMSDGENDLWLVHYDGQQGDGESLLDGIDADKKAISYLDTIMVGETSEIGVKRGTDKDINYFTPYRNKLITLEINPKYIVDDNEIGSVYNISYEANSETGSAKCSREVTTTATLTSKEDDAVIGQLVKKWKIATLCNSVEAEGVYIADHAFAENRNYGLLQPMVGDTVIYQISSSGNSVETLIAVKYSNQDVASYFTVGGNAIDGYEIGPAWDDEEVKKSANEGNLVNYIIRRLPALTKDSGTYTLTIVALEWTGSDGIYYASSSVSYDFNVAPQELGDENDETFETYFEYRIDNRTIEYSEDENDMTPIINLKLRGDDIELSLGVDYYVSLESSNVGSVNLRIEGSRNLHGTHILKNAITITPARNEWTTLPGIITWTYGTYIPENNLIVGDAKFLSNPLDIKFRIVKLIANNDAITEEIIEGLSDIRYFVDESTGKSTGLVNDSAIDILKALDAGKYRLYASVYGVNSGETVDNENLRNYQPLPEQSVDFEIFVGTNSWKAGSEPKILGWTTGKLDTTDGLIDAASVFDDNPILMIYKLGENGAKDTLIYSNLPTHANTDVGDINVLKGLKAGRYYLSAEVKETGNYSGLKTTVLFDVNPNNLPIWAVILIVAGSLGVVAVVFLILHQKGILQMLTGKVIISMRTRANVDATLAAIRAAKVARDAEASVAAAKAREAEEAKQSEKSDK